MPTAFITDVPDLRLRPAQAGDNAFMRQLFDTTRTEQFTRGGLQGALLDRLLEQQFQLQAKGHARQFPDAISYIVERQQSAIGRLLLHCSASVWHVVDIALLPHCTGQGMGTAIMAGIETAARRQGADVLTLTVLAGNIGARRFYARLGFTEAGVVAGGAYLNAIKPLTGLTTP